MRTSRSVCQWRTQCVKPSKDCCSMYIGCKIATFCCSCKNRKYKIFCCLPSYEIPCTCFEGLRSYPRECTEKLSLTWLCPLQEMIIKNRLKSHNYATDYNQLYFFYMVFILCTFSNTKIWQKVKFEDFFFIGPVQPFFIFCKNKCKHKSLSLRGGFK